MRELTAEQIQDNYKQLLNTVQLYITGDRKDKVLKMYNELEDRISMAPASAKEHYHNAMLGGYIDHILRVVDLSLKVKEMWIQNGGKVKCEYMSVTDRAFYLLQYYNIPVSKKEFIGIRLTDGMYEEANKSYLMSYKAEFQVRSSLPHILHQADMMASRIEGELTKDSIEKDETEVYERIQNIQQAIGNEEKIKEEKPKITKDLFEELFGEKR